MTISIIVAASANNVIGINNQLPWHLPTDLKFFKNTTWGMPVIMGRKTFESMNNKPLPGRINIIITRQKGWTDDRVIVVRSLQEAFKAARQTDCKEAFVIGGGEVFAMMINNANRIYLTRVHAQMDGDIFFPEIDSKVWELQAKRDCNKDEKHAYDFSFEKWERRPANSM